MSALIVLDGAEATVIKIGWELWDKPCDFKLVFWTAKMVCGTGHLDEIICWD